MSDGVGVGAGWFADDKAGYERWWDGSAWTDHYRLSQQSQVQLHDMSSPSQLDPVNALALANSGERFTGGEDPAHTPAGWPTPKVVTIDAGDVWRPQLDSGGDRGTISGVNRWFIWASAGSLAILVMILLGVVTSGAEPTRDGFQDKTAVGDSLPDPILRPANIRPVSPPESQVAEPAGTASNAPVGGAAESLTAGKSLTPTTSVPASTMLAPPTIATP